MIRPPPPIVPSIAVTCDAQHNTTRYWQWRKKRLCSEFESKPRTIPPLKDTRAGLPEGRGEVAHCDRRVMCVVCCVLRGRHGAAVRGVDEAQGAGEADQAAAYRP